MSETKYAVTLPQTWMAADAAPATVGDGATVSTTSSGGSVYVTAFGSTCGLAAYRRATPATRIKRTTAASAARLRVFKRRSNEGDRRQLRLFYAQTLFVFMPYAEREARDAASDVGDAREQKRARQTRPDDVEPSLDVPIVR